MSAVLAFPLRAQRAARAAQASANMAVRLGFDHHYAAAAADAAVYAVQRGTSAARAVSDVRRALRSMRRAQGGAA